MLTLEDAGQIALVSGALGLASVASGPGLLAGTVLGVARGTVFVMGLAATGQQWSECIRSFYAPDQCLLGINLESCARATIDALLAWGTGFVGYKATGVLAKGIARKYPGFVRYPSGAQRWRSDTKYPIQTYWPPNGGFLHPSKPVILQPGVKIDRFGLDAGKYVSPLGTPFGARALPPQQASAPYSVFEVVKPITVEGGQAAPAFGQFGLGTQYKLPGSVSDLLAQGVLRRIKP